MYIGIEPLATVVPTAPPTILRHPTSVIIIGQVTIIIILVARLNFSRRENGPKATREIVGTYL